MSVRVGQWVLALALLVCPSSQQNNPLWSNNGQNNDPNIQQTLGNTFYFDSNSDCNSKVRNIYDAKATIKGHDGGGGVERGPESCTITLKSETQFPGTNLQITIIAMQLNEGDTVSIYDGDAAQNFMGSYDQRTSDNSNRDFLMTSSNAATFIMTRRNVERLDFNIYIEIQPIRSGNKPGYENNFGSWDTFDKYPQENIVGMIGGFYLAMLIVVATILVFYYKNLKGMDKKWETVQLSVMQTNTRFTASQPPSQTWSTAVPPSYGPNSHYSRTTADPYPRNHPPPGEDGDSVYKYDDTFQKRRLMDHERDRMNPPRYSTNNTFEDPDEDDPDHFQEKVITSRVRPKKRSGPRPPSYEEAVSSQASESENSSDEKSASSSDDESIHKRSVSSDDRSRRTRSTRSGSESETESESVSEEDSEDDSRRGHGARGGRRPPKRKDNRRKRRPESSDGDGPSRTTPRQPPAGPPMAAGYPAYPPGQFVPMMAGPQFQPMPMVPAYAPPHYPPQQQGLPAPQQPPAGPQPTDPPVYSYLVQRGYRPVDASSVSQGSVSGSQRSGGHLEEPDVRLNSGVEYMRR